MNKNDLAVRRGFLANAMGFGAAAATVGLTSTNTAQAQTAGDLGQVTNFAALRSYTGSATTLHVLGRSIAGDAGGGVFRKETGSIPFADNDGTVITPSGVSGSSVAWLRVYSGPMDVRWFGAEPHPSNFQHVAIQKALDAATWIPGGASPENYPDRGGSEVYIPPGTFRINAPLLIKIGVSLIGDGLGSHIRAIGFDAIRFEFNTSFGNSVVRGLQLTAGAPAREVAQVGINVPGSTNVDHQLHGITIENCLIRDFGVGIHFRSVKNFSIINNWIQNVEVGIELKGRNLVGFVAFNKVAYGDGNIFGENATPRTPTALLLDSDDFTQGNPEELGRIPNEGIQILSNSFYGFHDGINVVHSRFVNINMNDVHATVNGVLFKYVELSLNIKDNYIEASGAAAMNGIKGAGAGFPMETQVNIEGNSVFGNNVQACTGIEINDATARFQDHVRIVRNVIQRMAKYDILINRPGPCTIENNRCMSINVTKSIKVGVVEQKPVFVFRNFCQKTIELNSADLAAGAVKAGDNIVNGSNWL